MNIIVRPYGSELCYCRPDTTWERENKDFYVPDGIGSLQWTPIVFVRIGKAGKCIGKKFASRYYDAFSFGALLYCIPSEGASETAFTSCMDHTSLLPFPLYDTVVMDKAENEYKVWKNGKEIFRSFSDGVKEAVEEAVCAASRFTSLRIGDFVAVELAPAAELAGGAEEQTGFKATYCGNNLYDLKILF